MQKKYEASVTISPKIEVIARDLSTVEEAIDAIQKRVEEMRIKGITGQIEASIHNLLREENSPEVGHFIFRPKSTTRIAVKVSSASSTIPANPETKEEGLKDLLNVGPQKPLGYLPLEYIERYRTPEALQRELEERGLIVKTYAMPNVPSLKFMFAYDQTALQKLLDENISVLKEARCPRNAEKFVERIAIGGTVDAYTGLFTLIATAFGDLANPGRSENIII